MKKIVLILGLIMTSSSFASDIVVSCITDDVEICEQALTDSLKAVQCDMSEAYTKCDLATQTKLGETLICTSMFVKDCTNTTINKDFSQTCGDKSMRDLTYGDQNLRNLHNVEQPAKACKKN